jgi:hypothetical protein
MIYVGVRCWKRSLGQDFQVSGGRKNAGMVLAMGSVHGLPALARTPCRNWNRSWLEGSSEFAGGVPVDGEPYKD